ncbi:MAG: hypothetical protein GF418_01305 [Chitinivibrionales bacterium]|nr:hypothetical protein [Chitinivibrionales bacterium]MBD3394239.1 hypothetical protein [Chitinivibrionales bacterium]
MARITLQAIGNRLVCAAGALMLSGLCARAATDVEFTPRLRVSYNLLQMVNTISSLPNPDDPASASDKTLMHRAFVHNVSGEFGIDGTLHERIRMYVGFRAQIGHSFLYPAYNIDALGTQAKRITAGLTESKGTFIFGDVDQAPFVLTAGYFDLKYNPDAQDLGEYLLSSGCYPGYVFSGGPEMHGVRTTKLAGLWLDADVFEKFRQDLVASVEIFVIPNYDISISYLFETDIREIVTLGGGVSFHRLISANENNTTPASAELPDPDDTTKTIKYTHRGVKLMGRIALDPKPLFSTDIFGERDLRLYAEAAVLGVKNYPIYYENISERIPVMVGFNLPTFKLLDVLAVEGEWYGSTLNNNPYSDVNSPYPVGQEKRAWGSVDDFKWAVSARRTLMEHIAVTARVACDHLRLYDGTAGFEMRERTIYPYEYAWSILLEAYF